MNRRGSPERPARGLPPEQALERWSDPEAYAAMREFWDHRPTEPQMLFPEFAIDPREEEYRRRRRPLEEALLERLRLGELLATAIPAGADPSAARMLLDPEVFHNGTLLFEKKAIDGPHGSRLLSVEIFEPPGLPRNVRTKSDWYWQEFEPPQGNAEGEPSELANPGGSDPQFWHDPDYRQVRIHGTDFDLSPMQAQIVRLLHEASLRGEPRLYGRKLLADAGSRAEQVSHVFRRQKAPHWSLLIRGDRFGYYGLNLRR